MGRRSRTSTSVTLWGSQESTTQYHFLHLVRLRIQARLETHVSFYISSLKIMNTKMLVALADIDPLDINHNISFNDVGGLEERRSKNCFPFPLTALRWHSFLCYILISSKTWTLHLQEVCSSMDHPVPERHCSLVLLLQALVTMARVFVPSIHLLDHEHSFTNILYDSILYA